MSSKQYTIRSIPEPVDKALRQRARKSGQSFNATVLEALKRGTGVDGHKNTYSDLDHLIGVGIKDEQAFCEAIDWLDSLPSDMQENSR
jgi:plasmid stability protein